MKKKQLCYSKNYRTVYDCVKFIYACAKIVRPIPRIIDFAQLHFRCANYIAENAGQRNVSAKLEYRNVQRIIVHVHRLLDVPMELQINCGYARVAIRKYTNLRNGKRVVDSNKHERAQELQRLFNTVPD